MHIIIHAIILHHMDDIVAFLFTIWRRVIYCEVFIDTDNREVTYAK